MAIENNKNQVPSSLDQSVLRLAKSIRKAETGSSTDPYNERGASGEFGAYQITPDTYKAYASKYLGDENAAPDITNQNKIVYSFIKEKKDAGFSPAQIASMWNAGEDSPDAYKTGLKGTNEMGVDYDVAEYVRKVSRFFNEGASSPTSSAPKTASNEKGTEDKSFVRKAAEFFFPIIEKKERTPLQWVGDIGLSALTLLPGLGQAGLVARGAKAASVAGKALKVAKGAGLAERATVKALQLGEKALGGSVGRGAAVGYGADVLSKLSSGESDVSDVLTPGVGTITGGALGGAGKLLEKAADMLPEWVVKKFIPTKNEDIAKFAAGKKLTTPKKMLVESERQIKSLDKRIDKALLNPKRAYYQPTNEELFRRVMDSLPEAKITPQSVVKELNKIAPLKEKLIDRLVKGENLSLVELRKLNTHLGKGIFKMSKFDVPEIRRGKEIAAAFRRESSEMIKDAVPSTRKMFEDITKEIGLRDALDELSKKGSSVKVGLPELIAFFSGGPLATAGYYAAKSPSVNLMGAQALRSAVKGKTGGLVGRSLVAPISRGAISTANRSQQPPARELK